MADDKHIAEELRRELLELRRRLVDLEASDAERRRAEEALRLANSYNRRLIETSLDPFVMIDPDGRISDLNAATEKVTGCSRDELIGSDFCDYFTEPEKAREGYRKAFKEGLVRDYALDMRHRDGHLTPVIYSASVCRDESGKVIGVFAAARDITVRRRIEEELMKARKLESVGVLAGGIAHDFNNLLAAILGNISLAKSFIDEGGKAHERLTKAEECCVLAEELTGRLLTFSEGGAPWRKVASMAHLLKQAVRLALSGSNVRCELSLPSDLWPVEIDEGQMRQVVHHLVMNAREAMPDGGTITVSAENLNVPPGSHLPLREGRYVRWSVADEGVGIPKANLQRLFDPYFTTKDVGSRKGMGLGLTICYSIIKKHDGFITAQSEPGAGATFHVYLPAARTGSPGVRDEDGLPAGRARILVMDDEESVREMVGETLDYLGYEAVLAAEGNEAVALYEKARDEDRPFAAVIMDLTIPGGMGGKETVARLLAMDPHAKVIISSGYSSDPVVSEFGAYGFSEAVVKPYTVSDLRDVLSAVLTGTKE